jgi:hypothetical protein
VRVDSEGFFAERGIENDIGRLAPNSRQRLQLFASARHVAVMSFNERLTQGDYILRLRVEQADGFDRVTKRILAELHHLARRLYARKERAAGDINACVSRLGREHDRNQKLVRIAGLKFGRWRWIGLRQAAKELKNLVALHRYPITSRIE